MSMPYGHDVVRKTASLTHFLFQVTLNMVMNYDDSRE